METPPELIEAFTRLNNAFFEDVHALVQRVREISDQYKCRYVPRSTGEARSMQLFCCRQYRTIYYCNACLRILYNPETQLAQFNSCDLNHTHEISASYNGKERNQLSETQKTKIRDSTLQGLSAYNIRIKQGLVCSKDVLYNTRREILKNIRDHEMDELLDQMKNGNNWSNKIIIDENKRFNGCHVFHEPIMSEKYANDLCIIDDTSCTNYYHLPLLLMISEDQNGRNQVLSFAIICSRTKNEFINYFVEIKQKIGDIRLFICD